MAPLNWFKPSNKSFFTDRSKAVLLQVGVCCNVVSAICSLVVIC